MRDLPGARLELAGVTKSFNRSGTAVRGVNLTVEAGEFLTLLGPSGSGKTTTLNMIAGFITPDSGSIKLDGVDAAHTPVHKRGIGMVFQQFSLFPHMTVGENIAFPLKERRVAKNEIEMRIAEVLETVGLSGYADRKPNELSGGQQQRVALARAIVFRPRLLLMDEPLSALDKTLREHLQIEIKRIQRQLGVTCIYVTHDQEEGLLLSDRIAVFNEGEIVQIASPSELYERPKRRFVAEFVGDSNIFSGTLTTEADGTRTFTCTEGRFRVTADPQLTDGEANVLVRPENISIVPCDGADDDSAGIPCKVVESDYYGASTKSWLRTESGRMLHVRLSRDQTATLGPGTRVRVRWQPEHAHVLRD